MGEKAEQKGEKEPPRKPYYCKKHGLKIYFRLSFCMELRDCSSCEYRVTIGASEADLDKNFVNL